MKFKINIAYAIICFLSISANGFTQHVLDWDYYVVDCEIPSENNSEKESNEKSEIEEEDEFVHARFSPRVSFAFKGASFHYKGLSLKELHIGEIPSPPPDLS